MTETTEQTAVALAKKVADLLAAKADLEAKVADLEQKAMDSPSEKVRSARQAMDDVRFQLENVNKLIRSNTDEGERTLADEIRTHRAELDERRVDLIAQRTGEVDGHLMPTFLGFLALRLEITGQDFGVDDWLYLKRLHNFGFDDDMRIRMTKSLRAMQAGKDLTDTILAKLNRVQNDLWKIRNGKLPSFENLVETAQKGLE